MTEFFLAFLVFLLAHILPPATGLRAGLIARVGRPAYLAAFSLLSLAAIAWVISAALRAPYIELWPASRATALVPLVAMPAACVLLAAPTTPPPTISTSNSSVAISLPSLYTDGTRPFSALVVLVFVPLLRVENEELEDARHCTTEDENPAGCQSCCHTIRDAPPNNATTVFE